MQSIFWRTIKDRGWTLFSYSSIGIFLAWMYIATYPSVQKTSAQVSGFVESLPPALTKAFGLDPRSFTTFEGFIAGKHFSLLWPILMVILVTSLAGAFIAGEIEKGTVELLLAQPISRIKIFLSKFSAGIFAVAAFVIFSVLAVIPIAQAYHIPFSAKNFTILGGVGFIFGLAIYGLSMLASSIFSEKGKATFVVIGALLVMYVLNIIALLKDNLDKLKYLSLFYYFNYSEILFDGKNRSLTWGVFLGTFLLASMLGLFWFERRDIAA